MGKERDVSRLGVGRFGTVHPVTEGTVGVRDPEGPWRRPRRRRRTPVRDGGWTPVPGEDGRVSKGK